MDGMKEFGRLQKSPCKIKQIEWSIPDFFAVCEFDNHLSSPCFSFTDDVLWRLELRPNWRTSSQEYIQVYIFCKEKEEREYDVEYYIGMKTQYDDIDHLISGIFRRDDTESDGLPLIKKDRLCHDVRLLVPYPSNTFTIIFTMKFKRNISFDETRPLKLIKLEKLSENFDDLFADKETCDVTLKVQDKEYKAHRSILMARSSVFTATFKHDMLEKQTGIITITDCDPDSFEAFLKYLYSGKLKELSFRSALNLYYTSDKYQVVELKTFCIEYLAQSLTVENACEIAVFADKYCETQLFSKVQDFFNKNYLKVLLTSEWKHLFKSDHNLADKLLTTMAKMQLKVGGSSKK